MNKIKHDEAISIVQLILTFLMSILGMCKKNGGNDNVNDNDNDNDNQ